MIAPVSRPNPFLYTRGRIRHVGTMAIAAYAYSYEKSVRRKSAKHFSRNELEAKRKEAAILVMGPKNFHWIDVEATKLLKEGIAKRQAGK